METRFENLLVVPLITLLLAAGCGNPRDQKSDFDLNTAKKEIEEADKNFSELMNKGDSVGVANFYTEDAKLLTPSGPATVGRKSIQTAEKGFIDTGLKLGIKSIEVWGDESLLAEEGTWVVTTQEGQPVDNGKYLVLWKKEDGKWWIFRDCINSSMAVKAK